MKAVLVLNAGSSSLKFALYPINGDVAEAPAVSGQVEGIGATPEITLKTADGGRIHEAVPTGGSQGEQHRDALNHVFALLNRHNPALDIVAAGHRIVHGGEHYSAPTRLDEAVLRTLDTFVPLAPLHQPHNLRAVRAVAMLMPNVPQVGCFDTAFHRTQPAVAQAFALPRKYSAEGVKRYGFHGLSYDYVARQLPDVIGERARGAVVIAHLGNGASMCALRDGKSVAMRGFMAPPLKAEAKFFVLTEIPMALCPFCSSDADWPSNIVVVYIDEKTTFVPPSKLIEVTGTLDVGSWTDPETGFVSLLRLVHSSFETV